MRHLLLSLLVLPQMALAGLPFAIVEAVYRPAPGGYSTEAVVEAGRESTLSSQVSGRILVLDVDAGDGVRQGQLLVRIDDSEARNNMADSQAQVAQARANLANAQAQYERARQLVARKFMSPSSLDKAQAEYRVAEAQLAAAKAGVSQSSTTRKFTSITAPFSGLVSARLAQVGEMASLGRPLLTVFDPATLRVVATVPQERLDRVRKSGRASVEFPAIGKTIESAAVTILPAADSRTHSSQVRIEFPQGVTEIYPGMFARAYFTAGDAKKMLLPEAAILRRSEVTGVYVVDGDKVQFRQVRIGPATAGGVEILAGLQSGERIAVEPVKAGIYLKKIQAHD
jgi:RND family efflux transporter MFP subunit